MPASLLLLLRLVRAIAGVAAIPRPKLFAHGFLQEERKLDHGPTVSLDLGDLGFSG